MLSVIVASLLALVAHAAADCQYVLYQDDLLDYVPLGINRCHYTVVGGYAYSYKFTCNSETELGLTYYTTAFDCEGSQTSTTYTSSQMVFDCSDEKSECGKIFGFKTPCDCTKEDGNCLFAYALSIVDEVCVYYNALYYQQWEITCGSVSEAKAVLSMYDDTVCNEFASMDTSNAGCHVNTNYTYIYGTDEVDWIVCPANIQSFSIALVVALIAAAFSM